MTARNMFAMNPPAGVCHVHTVIMLELLVAQPEGLNQLLLDEGTIHTIFAIIKLNEVRVCAVVADYNIFQSFDKPTLNITSLSRINQSLTTHHGADEEFLRCKDLGGRSFRQSHEILD